MSPTYSSSFRYCEFSFVHISCIHVCYMPFLSLIDMFTIVIIHRL